MLVREISFGNLNKRDIYLQLAAQGR